MTKKISFIGKQPKKRLLTDPTRFSVRFTKENIKKIKHIQVENALHNRNMTINFIVENYYLYDHHKEFIQGIKKMIKGEMI